jgi:hypothetical protein
VSKTKLVVIDKRGKIVRVRARHGRFERATAFASPEHAKLVAFHLRAHGVAPRGMRRYGNVLTRVYVDTDPLIGRLARTVSVALRKRRVRHRRSR